MRCELLLLFSLTGCAAHAPTPATAPTSYASSADLATLSVISTELDSYMDGSVNADIESPLIANIAAELVAIDPNAPDFQAKLATLQRDIDALAAYDRYLNTVYTS